MGLSPTSAIAVVGWLTTEPPPKVPRLSLRGNRWDPWFAWYLHALARRVPPLSSAEAGVASCAAGTSGGLGAGVHEDYMILDDFLFRFDRRAHATRTLGALRSVT